MAEFKIDILGQECTFEVTRQGDKLQVVVDGETAELQLLHHDGSSFIVKYQNPDGTHQQIRALGHIDGDQRHLWVDGRTLAYKRVRERRSEHVLDGSLSSSIPAVVAQVLVSPGEIVSAGDKLILLESMKMIIPILAPCNSKVIAIHCSMGESVQAGVPLVELEETEI